MHRSSTSLPQVFHSRRRWAGLAAILAVFAVATIAPIGAQSIDSRSLYRVFLTDGHALPSYGEPTSLAGRIAFVLVVGDPRGRFELQLVSLPAAAVDARRTERYGEFLRGQQYAVTGGPTDYSAFTAEMTLALADIDKQPDARRKLDQALVARRRIVEWPAGHRFYRVADVRTMLRGLDVIVSDLARAAGVVLPALPSIPEPPRYEPEVPVPSARDWVELSLAAAAASGDNDTRAAILRNALAVAGTGEAGAPIRAELGRVTGQSPPASAKASAGLTPAPAKASAGLTPAPAKASAGLTPAPAAASTGAPAASPRLTPGAPAKGATQPKAAVVPPKVVAPPPKVAAAPPKVVVSPPTAVAAPPKVVAPPASAKASAGLTPAAVPPGFSSVRRALVVVTIGVVILAAGALVTWAIRRRPAPGPVEAPPVEVAAPEIAPAPPAPVTSPVITPVRAFVVPTSTMPQALELVTVRNAQQHGYQAVEGEVRNVSSHALENLEVAVRWYVSQGALLTSDEALLETEVLPEGRTVPFRVLTRSSPGMASYSLLFKSKGDVVAQFQKLGLP